MSELVVLALILPCQAFSPGKFGDIAQNPYASLFMSWLRMSCSSTWLEMITYVDCYENITELAVDKDRELSLSLLVV